VLDEILELPELDEIADRVRLQNRGELTADVVIVQGNSKETLRLLGIPIRSRGCAPPCSTQR
jgi:hypothetical protein